MKTLVAGVFALSFGFLLFSGGVTVDAERGVVAGDVRTQPAGSPGVNIDWP